MSDHLWAGVAFLALAGWTTTLVFLSKALLPMANALLALHKVDTLIDDRISKVLTRVRERQTPKAPAPKEEPVSNAAADAMRGIFGGAPLEPIFDQPDAPERLEVREA